MKRDVLFLFIRVLQYTTLFIVILSSCIFEQKNHIKNTNLPKAYWNQEDHDRAKHKIHQPRDLILTLSLKNGNESIQDGVLKLFTGMEKYGSEDECKDIIITENNPFKQNFIYNHSFIGIELSPPILPVKNGIHTIFLSWYRPDTWVKELFINIDIAPFSCQVHSPMENSFIQCDLFFHPDWEEKKVWVCFERLFALTSTPKEHPAGLSAKEAEIVRKEKGIMTVFLNMPGFFQRWNKNYSHPWEEGDTYPVSITLTLAPPLSVFREIPSNREDPPFVPGNYNGKVDSSEGDPYLFVPSTDPLKEMVIDVDINVPVTDIMVR